MLLQAQSSSSAGLIEIIIILFLLFGGYFVRKGKKEINKEKNKYKETSNNKVETLISIPDTCPLCKNPNSKKIRFCEWCGNQII